MAQSPSRQRRASELLKRWSAVNAAGDSPMAHMASKALHQEAAFMGMLLVSMTITNEPIPDPDLEALPRADLDRIVAITRDMRDRPAVHVAELERLVARHPHIPMLRNHLAGALNATGKRSRAEAIMAETARLFPTYIFAFCNHVLTLLSYGKIEEARALVETGPRGPLFTLRDFDATRDTFHTSEAISHASMVGHYMLATGQREAAVVQLKLLKRTAPSSPQYRSLKAALDDGPDKIALAAALLRMKADLEMRAERRAAKAKKPVTPVAPTERKKNSASSPQPKAPTPPEKPAATPKKSPTPPEGPRLFDA